MPFHENLKCIRISKKISIEEAYKGIGIARMTYINYETGQNTPNVKNLIKIANFLKTTTEELIHGKEPDINKKLLYRLRKMEEMPEIDINKILIILDALIMESDAHNKDKIV